MEPNAKPADGLVVQMRSHVRCNDSFYASIFNDVSTSGEGETKWTCCRVDRRHNPLSIAGAKKAMAIAVATN
jgi:hypothetical protein